MKTKSNDKKSVSDVKKEPSSKISPALPVGSFFPLVNDSTSHLEISFMQNDNYSKEIIDGAKRVFNLEKLRGLSDNHDKYLKEAKLQLNKLCQSIMGLKVHTDLFTVTFMINLGYLLKEIRPTFKTDATYYTWLTHNSGGYSFGYFQHAIKLADMGETAINYRSLGVNRLLEVERLERDLGKSFDEILKEHLFLDTTKDFDGSQFKTHVDAIISYYRLKKKGIDQVKWEQVLQTVQYNHRDIEVREVNRIKKGYDKAPDKNEFLDQYVQEKMTISEPKASRSVSEKSLNLMLAMINEYFEQKGRTNFEWIKEQKKLLGDSSLLDTAYKNLAWLKKKLRKL